MKIKRITITSLEAAVRTAATTSGKSYARAMYAAAAGSPALAVAFGEVFPFAMCAGGCGGLVGHAPSAGRVS